MKCSRRSSVHFTGRPSRRAAQGTSTSSGQGCTILTPKPPPTSGVTTSTRSTGSPSLAAIACRTLVEVWVDVCTSSDSSSASQRASTPLPSSGIDALRSMASSSSSRWGAASIAASASPVGLHHHRGLVAGHVRVHQVLRGPGDLDADHDGQQLVVHPDPLADVLGGVPVVGDHHHHRLADVVDLVPGQRVGRPAVGQRRVRDQQRQRLAGAAVEVLVGVDRHQALDLERVADVDVEHPRVRVRAADEGHLERVVAEVVEEPAGTGDQPGVLDPRHPLAEHPGAHRSSSRGISSAARWTASTMLT